MASKKYFYVDTASRVSWDKSTTATAWLKGRCVPFVVASSDIYVEGLFKGGGLYFARELLADVLRGSAAAEKIIALWQEGARGERVARLFPRVIILEAAGGVAKGKLSLTLRPVEFPVGVLGDALDRAAAEVLAGRATGVRRSSQSASNR